MKSSVISRGIDITHFKSKKIFNNKKNYLFVPSRISSWKGHDLLLDYFVQFPKKYKEKYKLLFISSHSSNDEIKVDRIIKKNNLNKNIEFIEPYSGYKKNI